MIAEELHDKPNGGVKHKVSANHLTLFMRPMKQPIKKTKNQELSERFVQLRRMQRDAQWHTGKFVGFWFGERNRPRSMADRSPTTAGSQTAEPADRMSNR